jgi:PAS domain S-box-containing protein
MSRILIVDDREENLYYLETLLISHGYQVDTASQGNEALEKARNTPPDMIVSDLLMPIMDGYTLLQQWKSDSRLSHIPFIIYTATYTEESDRELALDLGADAFILKSVEPEAFLKVLWQIQDQPHIAKPIATSPVGLDENTILKTYNQTLVRKLEEKSRQLEIANRALEKDIARREATEAALRVSVERFRLLAQATSDAAWDWDMLSDNRWWNDGFTQLFGHRRTNSQPDDAAWAALIHPDDREEVLAGRRLAISQNGNNHWSASYRFRCADGHWAQVEDRGHLIRDDNGTVIRMVGGMTDITNRITMEKQLHRAQRLEALGMLTGGVAHDFNNLLTVVMGNAQILEDSLHDHPDHQKLASMITEAAERGADLTHRLLAFARQQSLTPRAVNLNQLVLGIELLLQRTLGSNIVITLELDSRLPAIYVDPSELEHALLNLCVNGRDAMPLGGSLTISTRAAQTSDSTELDLSRGQYVVLSITDTGTGIAPELVDRLFEPFFTSTEQGGGTGLGLAMVHGFINQSGGQISVHSKPGEGSTFLLYLPVSDQPPTPLPVDEKPSEKIGGNEWILLVEDDHLVRHVAKHQLESLGYQVITANDGQQALDLLREGNAVDLLFTDLRMPGMGGRQLAQLASEQCPYLKILFTTGFAGHDDEADGLQDNTNLIRKPYHRAELAQCLRRVLTQQDNT